MDLWRKKNCDENAGLSCSVLLFVQRYAGGTILNTPLPARTRKKTIERLMPFPCRKKRQPEREHDRKITMSSCSSGNAPILPTPPSARSRNILPQIRKTYCLAASWSCLKFGFTPFQNANNQFLDWGQTIPLPPPPPPTLPPPQPPPYAVVATVAAAAAAAALCA